MSRLLRRRPALVAAAVVALVTVALVALFATREVAPGTTTASPLVGQRAPAITGRDLVSGRPVSLAADRGHYVVVNFFASWCPPCATEAPQLVAFLYAERSIHADAIGVVYDDSAGNARSFLRKEGATWPAVVDPDGSLAASYGVSNPPESFLVAPNGRVVVAIAGGLTEAMLVQSLGIANAEGA